MKGKFCALFLALALSASPLGVFADGPTRAGTPEELAAAAADPDCSVIELTADITLSAPLSFERPVTLQSAEAGSFAILADPAFPDDQNLVTFTAGGVLRDLTLNASARAKYAVHAYNCALEVSGCRLEGGRYRGLLVNGANASASVADTAFANNTWAAIEVGSGSAGTPAYGCLALGSGITWDNALVQADISGADPWAGRYVVTDQNYTFPACTGAQLQDALDAGQDTLILGCGITLTRPVEIPAGRSITVQGGGYTLSLSADSWAGGAFAAFNNTACSPEGLQAGTSLTLEDICFQGHTQGQAGHAVILGSTGGVTVLAEGCTFLNLYDAVYCNAVCDPAAASSPVTIRGCTFTNVANFYGVDDGYTAGGRVDKHTFLLEENTGDPGVETFALASVDGVGYTDLKAALQAAQAAPDKTVTLRKDVALDKMLTLDIPGITLDLAGHALTGSAAFAGSGNAAHLVDITADGVQLKNGVLRAGAGNNHTLNIWNGKDVLLSDLTLDGSAAGLGGAPLIVGASSVKVKGSLETITGPHSWYAVNVDSRTVGEAALPGSLTLAEGSALTFSGSSPLGIYLEDTAQAGASLAFEPEVSLSGAVEGLVAVAAAEGAAPTVLNPQNAGLAPNPDGTYILCDHTSTLLQGRKDATCTAEGYTGDTVCAGCGKVLSLGSAVPLLAHTYENGVCTQCGGADPSYQPPEPTPEPAPEPTPEAQPGSSSNDSQGSGASSAAAAPVTSAANITPVSGRPQTGDGSALLFWAVLLTLSAAAWGGVNLYLKKRAG